MKGVQASLHQQAPKKTGFNSLIRNQPASVRKNQLDESRLCTLGGKVDTCKQTRLRPSASAATLGKPIMKDVVADLSVPAKLSLCFAACLQGLDMRKHLLLPCCTGLFHEFFPKSTAARYASKDVLWRRVTPKRGADVSEIVTCVKLGETLP